MAKVVDLINHPGKTHFSFELLPPLKGEGVQALFKHIEPLMEFNPAFIDVTSHREEYVYKQMSNGLLEKRTVRKRPGTVGICSAIMHRFHVETVPHIICGGFSKEETENALIDLHFIGVENVLALRGDAIKSEGKFIPEIYGNQYASDLIDQIKALNQGKYLDEEITHTTKTNFGIGIAGYPEKHFESPHLQMDLKYLKQKIDRGAQYIVTQMFFDNQKFFDFQRYCQDLGINVPIIPGLKPISSKKQLQILPSIFHVDIPMELAEAVEACKNDQEVKKVGIEWCYEQSKELKAKQVPCLHYYSMGRSEAILEIGKRLGGF